MKDYLTRSGGGKKFRYENISNEDTIESLEKLMTLGTELLKKYREVVVLIRFNQIPINFKTTEVLEDLVSIINLTSVELEKLNYYKTELNEKRKNTINKLVKIIRKIK